ncbi:MAG: circadian clock protein KaiC [Thermoplasmata archaeon]|nr:circadian clock protein KaiC [Thermoplasmata archaeon]
MDSAMKKVKSGIYGLNHLLDGGMNEKSTTVVIGATGAGKTTFAIQFIRRGLMEGQDGIFVSLDENKDQIIREAVELGWDDILTYLDNEQLVFIDASGREFSTFIRKELPSFVADWEGADTRIAIDPLTPVLWSTKEQYEQRELVGFMLKETRKVGTVLATLEEHGMAGNLSGPETVIPMYLADCVIHMLYKPFEGEVKRKIKIIKCRNSRHSEFSHNYYLMKGLGLIVDRGNYEVKGSKKISAQLRDELVKATNIPPTTHKRLLKILSELRDDDFKNLQPTEVIRSILSEYSED